MVLQPPACGGVVCCCGCQGDVGPKCVCGHDAMRPRVGQPVSRLGGEIGTWWGCDKADVAAPVSGWWAMSTYDAQQPYSYLAAELGGGAGAPAFLKMIGNANASQRASATAPALPQTTLLRTHI
jgi:hypothetical protein